MYFTNIIIFVVYTYFRCWYWLSQDHRLNWVWTKYRISEEKFQCLSILHLPSYCHPAMWCYCIAVKCNSLCSSIAPRWVSNQEGVMFPGLHAAEVAHGRFAHFELSSGLVRKGKHTAYTRYLEDLTKTILSIILQAPARQFAAEDNKSTTDWETWLYWPITPL